jgi:hypothetical protein
MGAASEAARLALKKQRKKHQRQHPEESAKRRAAAIAAKLAREKAAAQAAAALKAQQEAAAALISESASWRIDMEVENVLGKVGTLKYIKQNSQLALACMLACRRAARRQSRPPDSLRAREGRAIRAPRRSCQRQRAVPVPRHLLGKLRGYHPRQLLSQQGEEHNHDAVVVSVLVVIESLLFHSFNTPASIRLDETPGRQVGTRSSCNFGRGFYFSNSLYLAHSHCFVDAQDPRGRALLLCKVLVGKDDFIPSPPPTSTYKGFDPITDSQRYAAFNVVSQ